MEVSCITPGYLLVVMHAVKSIAISELNHSLIHAFELRLCWVVW